MRSAAFRVITAAVLAVAGAYAVRSVAMPDGREGIAALFGVELERPKRSLMKCAEDAVDCVDWYHDNVIPSGLEYLLLYTGLVLVALFAGVFAARGRPTHPFRGMIAGALAGVILCGITALQAYDQIFNIPEGMAIELVRSFAIYIALLVGGAAAVGYLGGRIARPVA